MKNITYISASAGSGKTYELTERLKEVILGQKAKPEEVILTTFTKAAASEFKEKAKAKFYEAGKIREANCLDQALIGTVDSVSNFFVMRYWYLLGISPKLNIISEDDEQVYISESLSSLPSKEQNDFFHKFAETFRIPNNENNIKTGINYNFWMDDLKRVFNASRSYRITDYADSISSSKKFLEDICSNGIKLNFDREDILEKLDSIDAITGADKPSGARDNRIEATEKFRRVVRNPDSTQIEIGFALEEMISKGKFTTKGYQNCNDYLELEAAADRIWTCQDVRDFQILYVEHLFEIAGRWLEKYMEYKREQHIIDYTDMEEYFLTLLEMEEVQNDVKKSYKYLFVDEFQDCSPTQIRIFDKLSELVEHSIWVGDYKQAIYGFRGSDTALVKAVTDRIEKLNGVPNKTLDTSHRSWPPVVDVNNGVFISAFSDILREEEVKLNYWDILEKKYNANKRDCLKTWVIDGIERGKKSNKKIAEQVASNIARMIRDEKILAKDIAVLARSNTELTGVASALKEYNIPTLVGDSQFTESDEIVLINALLSLVVNPYDTMARAKIAYLTESGYGAATILDKRFESISQEKKDIEYLDEIPLIKKLMAKREEYNSQSIAGLVENIIIEMDLYNIAKQWQDSDNSANTFHIAISIAQAYEDHCIQMSLPCTIYGFIDYISTVQTKAAGASDGVQFFTYHGAKGLEWKNVILLSLGDDILDEDKMIGKNLYGVHTFHDVDPNADDPYPPMLISVLPWIFGAKKKIPDSIKNIILENPKYAKTQKNVIQEEKRLMYVAMTRPVESMILVANQDNGLLRLKQLGVSVVDSLPLDSSCDIFGIGNNFAIENVTDMEEWKFKTPEKKILNIFSDKKDYKNRDQQPSSYVSQKDISASLVYDSCKRITLKAKNEEMDKVGTCLHDIYCVLENRKEENFVKEILKNHQMEKSLPDVSEIINAWNNLEKFLTENYGEKVNTYHELPFKQMYEGQIFTGSIDFAWETKDGIVLVDYKSYPGSKEDVINPAHEHYAGKYTGQFECYERALISAGKRVLSKIVYYHVMGVGVEIK